MSEPTPSAGDPASSPPPAPTSAAGPPSAEAPAAAAGPGSPPPPSSSPEPGSPSALLASLADAVAPEAVDELWIFPPRPVAGAESTLVVLSAFADEPVRRRVLTARFAVTRKPNGKAEVARELTEQGTAPEDRIGRVVDGVVRRLDEDSAAPPRRFRIAGDATRWQAALDELAAPGVA